VLGTLRKGAGGAVAIDATRVHWLGAL